MAWTRVHVEEFLRSHELDSKTRETILNRLDEVLNVKGKFCAIDLAKIMDSEPLADAYLELTERGRSHHFLD